MDSKEDKKIRKIVGQNQVSLLQKVFNLNNFIKKLGQKLNDEPNIKPIRRIVGRLSQG